MRTRNHDWLDTHTLQPIYGVQIYVDGKWRNAMFDGKPVLCKDKRERDLIRSKIKRIKS